MRYYFLSDKNLGEKHEPPYHTSYVLNSTTAVFFKDDVDIKSLMKGGYAIKQRNQPSTRMQINLNKSYTRKKD